MKLASIDVGTNSIHTIVVEVRSDGTFETIDRIKEMVRLGADQSDTHGLTSRAFTEGVAALKRTKQLCDRHGVEKICAVATSAVRESPNGAEFVHEVGKQTGIRLDIITGPEEARLIHAAVSHAFDFGGRRALIVDIGGGSVEFVVGSQEDIHFVDSVKAGVLRLRDLVRMSDPPTPAELTRLRAAIEPLIARPVREVMDAGFDFMIATSGTANAIQALASGDSRMTRNGDGSAPLSRDRISTIAEKLGKMRLEDRRALAGISPGRADTILPGAMLLTAVMEAVGAEELTCCPAALREGVLIDYLSRNRRKVEAHDEHPDPRRRTVLALAERCRWHERHSRQVASLAVQLFDQLKPVHGLDAGARELLEFGGFLHDIGYVVNADRHHKHSWYIVSNGALLGFQPEEVQIVAALCRYHRGRLPKRSDVELDGLPSRHRHTLDVLAGILRVADGLDRTHHSLVHRVLCDIREDTIDVLVSAHGDAELELYHARKKSDLMQMSLGRTLRIGLEAGVDGTATASRAR